MMNSSNNELILVTGGAGFIGSHTVDRLASQGYRVVVMDNFSSGKRENLARWADDPQVSVVEANVADGLFAPLANVTLRLGPISRIIHLAAQVSVVYSVLNPLEDARTNYAGSLQVLEYARCSSVARVVFASSSAVYGDEGPFPVTERAQLAPASPYAVHKLAVELALRYYWTEHRLPSVALRFFNVYGPRQDPSSPYSGVISIFAERAARGAILPIYGDGDQTRDFVYVGDVAAAIAAACFAEGPGMTVLNVGTGSEVTINELARLIIQERGTSSAVEHRPSRPGDARRSVAEVGEARHVLGFTAQVPLHQGLRETLAAI